ncbi:MAG TPA: hypothetical protein VKD91_01790 [Pyrinomonadaceae bacterium]|nr:hypothetical protein [Pyrinomonadaceae bacterium]
MLNLEAVGGETAAQFLQISDAQDDVNVFVRARLRLKQRINAPSAVKPDSNRSTLE